MSARRSAPLKLLRQEPQAITAEALLGGVGIEWTVEPDLLDEDGLTEWRRLGEVYATQPTRFREGDRAAVTAYCSYWSIFRGTARDVRERGAVVTGRSSTDRGRVVKNPATVAMREASVQLRYWARELALTPDSRGRTGIVETPERDDTGNPFAGGTA